MPYLPAVENRVLELSSSALRVHRFSRRSSTRLLALLATVLPITLPAAVTNYVWDGNAPTGGGNNRWTRAANWAADVAPPANTSSGLTNTDLTFAGSLKTTPLLDNNYFVRTVTFAPGAAAFTITPSSSQQIAIGGGGIVNNSTNRQTFLNSLVLSNSQTWNAAVGDLVIRGPVNLGANLLTIAGARNVAITNTIQGSGALLKQGSGTLILAGSSANTFSGGVTIQAGTVTVAKTNALGTGPLTVAGGVLNLDNFSQSFSSLSLLGGTINSAAGILSSSTAYQFQAGTVNSRLGGAGGVVKTTAGIVTLTAFNSYAGGTTIGGGKLVVNNLSGSGTGTGPVSVSNGGLLAGTGSISGRVTNALGGSISAGNEIGVLNLGSTVWFGGATNRWDLGNATGTAGTGWDLLNINGTLTLNATAGNQAVIDITSFTLGGIPGLAANFDPTQSYLWTIVQTTGGIFFQPGESELTVFDLLTGNYSNPVTGGTFGVGLSANGKNLNVSFTPVPEPNKLAFLGLSLCGMIYGRRLKRNW
jgi:autotransporter-associated beta strand protein